MRFTMKTLGIAAPLLLTLGLVSCAAPSAPAAAPAPPLPKSGCYGAPTTHDLNFDGRAEVDNIALMGTTGGTCHVLVALGTGVYASNLADANTACDNIQRHAVYPGMLSDLAGQGYTGLTNIWLCEWFARGGQTI